MYRARAERVEAQILGKVTEERGATSYHCNAVNISLTGALIEMGQDMASGSILNFTFRIPGFKNTLSIPSEIVRREGEALESGRRAGFYRYGIRFIEVKEEEREVLAAYICRLAVERTFPPG